MAPKEPLEEPLAPHPDLPLDFSSRSLPVVESTRPWYRLNPVRYESALFFDRGGKGRFDGQAQGYGILYVGADEYAAFIECFGRAHGARGYVLSNESSSKFVICLIASHALLIFPRHFSPLPGSSPGKN